MTTQERRSTKKPSTAKTSSAAKAAELEAKEIEVIATKDVDDKSSEPEKAAESTKAAKKKEATDGVICKSITSGGLYMEGIKSHIAYDWYDIGAEAEVEYQDIVAAIRSRSPYVFKPRFVIEDEDVIAEFPALKEVYASMYSMKELTDIFDLTPNGMVQTIETLPVGGQDAVKDLAAKMVADGRLDSVAKIKALDKYFGTNMMFLTEGSI